VDSLSRRAARLTATLPSSPPTTNIAFDSGHASPIVLPDLTAEAEQALTDHRAETLQYAPRPGLPELRERIAQLMREDGSQASVEQILVTNGAKHAIELACRLLLDEGDSIVVTAPTYFTSIPIFRSFGVSFVEVRQDEHGLDVDDLEAHLAQMKQAGLRLPKFVYNVPDFHNPTSLTMSLERREALLDLAVKHQLFIVEDSPYRRIRFEGDPVPPLFGLDRHERVLYMGTFSKLMAPGLRVGWVAAAPGMIARMIQLKSDGGSCPLTQRMIVEFCNAGKLASHIERVQATYRDNRDAMAAAVEREIPEASFTVPLGGYYLWLTLPETVSGDKLAAAASEGGVTVIPGSRFYARSDGSARRNQLRLAYSHATHDEIEEGVRRLASTYRAITARADVVAGRA
jgi:2-aminoadipate transaminase